MSMLQLGDDAAWLRIFLLFCCRSAVVWLYLLVLLFTVTLFTFFSSEFLVDAGADLNCFIE